MNSKGKKVENKIKNKFYFNCVVLALCFALRLALVKITKSKFELSFWCFRLNFEFKNSYIRN